MLPGVGVLQKPETGTEKISWLFLTTDAIPKSSTGYLFLQAK
jgi:hypothetical protein